MLYALFGTDTARSRKKLSSLLQTLLSKKPDAMVLRSDASSFDEATIRDYIESQGLFEQKSIIVLDFLFENKTNQTYILENLKDMNSSENVFILLEGKLDAKTKKKLEKHSTKMQECVLAKKSSKQSEFNIFELSDALGMRDRKKMWVLFQRGKLHNVSSEEMHGILFWSAKNMMLAKQGKNAKDAGLSPFVFQKADRFGKNFSDLELQGLLQDLVSLYHRVRRGAFSFDIGLEKFILDSK